MFRTLSPRAIYFPLSKFLPSIAVNYNFLPVCSYATPFHLPALGSSAFPVPREFYFIGEFPPSQMRRTFKLLTHFFSSLLYNSRTLKIALIYLDSLSLR